MKVGIDARLWSQTGIGRYIQNICLNLQRIDHKNEYVLFFRDEDKKDIEDKIKNKNWKLVKVNIKWHSLNEQIGFPKIIKKQKLDVVHFPYQQGVPVRYKGSYVVTIHDLIKHHYITGRSSTNPYWLLGFKMLFYKILINSAARNAKKIIAVSQSTKDEIFDHLAVDKRKVEVIYEAADDFESSPSKKIDLGKYFLFVGNVYQHKNAENLIKAFNNIPEENEVKLIFIGKRDYFYTKLQESVIKEVNNKRIIFIEDADDEILAAYYKNAVCLVRPSFMEGFSLPPLEAMESSGLVLASDIPVHREIFGDAIYYFNPNDYVDMGEKMLYVLNLSTNEREKKIREGKELAKNFSWKKTAEQTLRVYEGSSSI